MATDVLMVLLVGCLQMGSGDIDKSVCTPGVLSAAPPPALTTTRQFSVLTEWRETLTKRVYTVREYYDEARKLGSLYIQIPPQNDVKIVFDYSNSLAMVVQLATGQHATVCTVERLGTRMFRFDDKPWLTSIMSLYKAMMGRNDTRLISNSSVTSIRSYPVIEWGACLYDFTSAVTTKLRLFFTDPESSWFIPHLLPGEPMPVFMALHSKRQVNSSYSTEYNVVGDLLEFTPFPMFPPDAFTTPAGVFCPKRPPSSLPEIDKHFYMLMEIVDADSHKVSFDEIWYDYDAKRVRHDTKDVHGRDRKSFVYNFDTGARYEKDVFMGSCEPAAIAVGDVYAHHTHDDFIEMQSVSEIFHYKDATIQHMGEATVRGTQCDVYVGVYFDVNSNVNSTVQWYFTKRPWTEVSDTAVVRNAFFRMDIWQGGATNPVIYNILKYTPVPQHWNVFDVGDCYPAWLKIHFVVELVAEGNFRIDSVSKPYMYDLLQRELTNIMFEEVNRMSNLLVEYDERQTVFVSGQLLAKTSVTNVKIKSPINQRHLVPTYNFLCGTVEHKKIILLSDLSGSPIRLQTQKIIQISYREYFTTTTTLSTPSTVFRVPTLPATPPTPMDPEGSGHTPQLPPTTRPRGPCPTSLPVKMCPNCTHMTCKPCRECTCRPPIPCASVARGPTCSPCKQCPVCSTPTSTTSAAIKPTSSAAITCPQCACAKCSAESSSNSNTHSGISSGGLGGVVVAALLVGVIVCFTVLAVLSRYRAIPFLKIVRQDNEIILLGKY